MASKVPENLLYTKTHEWFSVDGGDTVTVGITDYAQQQLTDVVYVDLQEGGGEEEAG